jgi:Phosphodiester glycosidase
MPGGNQMNHWKANLAVSIALFLAACSSPPSAPDQNAQGDPFALTSLGEREESTATLLAQGIQVKAPQARVRISFIADVSGLPTIGVRSVFLCGKGSGCTKVGEAKAVALRSDDSSQGSLYADAAVNIGSIERIIVQPDPKLGATVEFKTEKLGTPLVLEPGGRHELFISIARGKNDDKGKPDDDKGKLRADFLVGGLVPNDVDNAFAVRADRASRLDTGGGSSVSLEPGSADTTMLLATKAQETGGPSPRISVYPEGSLNKPARVRLKVDARRLPRGLTLADYRASVGGQEVVITADGDGATLSANAMGDINLFTRRSVIETDSGNRYAVPGVTATKAPLGGLRTQANDTTTCANALVANRSAFESAFAAGNQAIKTNVCESVAPFVHIVLLDRSKTNRSITFPITPAASAGSYQLRTISEHATSVNALAAVNGFLWNGDSGNGAGQVGTISATLFTNGVQRSVATANEAMIGFSQNTGSGTGTKFLERSTDGNNWGTFNHNLVASTTSIIKNGACSRTAGDGPSNHWSAVGIGPNRVALVSSTTGTKTESFELCSVFIGLNYTLGAIRLDGGPSTAIYYNGTHLNPLNLAEWVIYGSARRIAYAVAYR